MRRRYLILAVGLVAFVGIVLAVLAMLPPRAGVTKANFDRIEKGMRLQNVEAIFGRSGEWRESYSGNTGLLTWKSDGDPENDVVVVGIHNGCVVTMNWYIGRSRWQDSSETLSDKLCRWLHLD